MKPIGLITPWQAMLEFRGQVQHGSPQELITCFIAAPQMPVRRRVSILGGYNKPIGHRTLGEFQRWVIRKAYTFIPFEFYDVNAKGRAIPEQEVFEL